MKMAKASNKDMNAAMVVAGILQDIDRGYFPRSADLSQAGVIPEEGDPDFFDADDTGHLRTLYDRVKHCLDHAPGGLFRVVFGYHTLLTCGILDPEKNHLDLHPHIRASLDRPKPSWRRCVDELPDDDTSVMVHVPGSCDPVRPAFKEGEHWIDLMDQTRIDLEVTHWTDYPEPPEA